ncbi:hypothetical protein PV325_004987 [Microctonus aethiopoides]|uniref:SprT-like domain-containing protein n=1 Tax=Microctonus aethiopoides TaxID=144406 RepID=A0AA39KW15_9HYME|nr:hypothetical protein PV325_004987 [Microctonus aethiopoides]KAK0175870.1 hypothetical protein PV328_000065 [Microctonus aethiopoides]
MELNTKNNDRWDTTRKKYIMSLKNRFQNSNDNVCTSTKNDVDNRQLHDEKCESEVSESTSSQNFSLRLSDSFIVNDTIEGSQDIDVNKENEKNKQTEIILISDSSDDECQLVIEPSKEKESPSNGKIPISKSTMTFSSIDVDAIHTESKKMTPTSRSKHLLVDSTQKHAQKNFDLLTCGDYNMGSTNVIDDDSGSVHLTMPNKLMAPRDNKNSENCRIKTRVDYVNKITDINSSNSKSTENINNGKNELCGTPNSGKLTLQTTPLTKKNVRDIAKVIKSTRAVYNSPLTRRQREIEENNSDTSEKTKSSPEINDNQKKIKHPAWIDETDSDNSEIIQNDKIFEPVQPVKTHLSRFLNPIHTEENSATLSELKKEEISRWLLTNPLDSRSDTSMSYVPPSEQNSLSSGNSSLDRLELKYETPNNRDKFRNKTCSGSNNKTKIIPTTTRQIQSANVKQTTMDRYLRKVKRGDKYMSNYTPVPISKTNNVISPSSPTENNSNLEIADCADILDKLYGNVWRDKADDLLPGSELKKTNPKVQNRAIETERKKIIESKKVKSSSSLSDDNSSNDRSDTLVNNVRSYLNSNKKPEIKNTQWRDSFINDNSCSDDSNGETTYQTALTTPQISNSRNYKIKETPMTALTRKAIEICDSDTEEDEVDGSAKRIFDNRRRLSFSDDEIDLRSSPGTSEYDPDDVIPPKTVIKPAKTAASKLLPKSATFTRHGVTKSFLASLSSSVPLENAHPEAKKYRINYKKMRDDLCKYLYKLYNNKIFNNNLPSDMLIEWNVRMRGTAGFCYNKTKRTLNAVERSSRIVLATKILDAPDRLRDTLVHEMCHAATWLINEVSDGHGPFWQAWASKAMKAFPELPSIKRCHDYKIATKYTYRCMSCSYSIGRHSKSLDVERKRCGHCYGKFELLINKTTKSGTVQVKTPSNKKPSGFALFVKENYHSVKKERRDVRHKEVMQILGQQFSAVKISNKNNNTEN